MKRIIILILCVGILLPGSVSVFAQSYVDLGLSSGTLWKKSNEGGDFALYTFDEAIKDFGKSLPTEKQLIELKSECDWSWIGNGYKVTGPNGNSIILPAAGSRGPLSGVGNVGTWGRYWSSTPNNHKDWAQALEFYADGGVYVSMRGRNNGQSVRLVQQKYVDLGLPSGTLWKDSNEDGYYAYDEAVRKFGSRLPTKAQFEELKDKCTWTWMGNGYKVTGPNGNSITFPATGIRGYTGEVVDLGKNGSYWSSTPYDSEFAWNLIFNSEGMGVDFYYRSLEQSGESVRLVL